jgi:uncharacterized membrane protein
MTLLAPLLIGFFGGLRTFTAPAVTGWVVHFGWLKLSSPLSLIGSTAAVVVLTLLAIGEYVFDKLPNAPNRTDPPGLIGRIVMGGLTGACISMGMNQGAVLGAVLGAIAAVVGCFTGYYTRKKIGQATGIRNLYLGLLEDLLTIAGSLLVVRF